MTLLLLRLHPPVFPPSRTFQHLLSISLPVPLPSFSPPPSQPRFSQVPSGAPKHCHPSPVSSQSQETYHLPSHLPRALLREAFCLQELNQRMASFYSSSHRRLNRCCWTQPRFQALQSPSPTPP